jgi:stearoyl-CoA desaturase (delta-9 desaturase)
VVTQVAIFSTTIYLHRTATHRGLVLHPAAAFSLRFSLWLTTGISTKEWVAVHRKHHAFTDEEGDPHSPLLKGFWRVQLGNVFYYIREARNAAVIEKFAPDIKDDFWDRWFFNYGTIGLLIGTTILCSVIGLWCGLLAAAIHAISYVFVLSPSINGLCHHVGYKNFGNTATNLRILALVTGGEGLHNNHHAFPRSPKFSVGRGEIDPAWPVVKLLTLLTLARPQRTIHRLSLGVTT